MGMRSGRMRAYVRAGALVAEFGTATQPFVWRYDLTKVHALALRAIESDGHGQLVADGGKGDSTPIATFPNRMVADSALRHISCALHKQDREKRAVACLAYSGALLLTLISLVAILASVRLFLPASLMMGAPAVATGQVQAGQPLSADQALALPTAP